MNGKKPSDKKDKKDYRISDCEDIDAGCARMLLEGKYLFNCIDTDEDFSKYKLIIAPFLYMLKDGTVELASLLERMNPSIKGKITEITQGVK